MSRPRETMTDDVAQRQRGYRRKRRLPAPAAPAPAKRQTGRTALGFLMLAYLVALPFLFPAMFGAALRALGMVIAAIVGAGIAFFCITQIGRRH